MTRAALRSLHSPDAPDLGTYAPADPSRFAILVQALIGPEGEPGEESFDFVVCTPSWLAAQLEHRPYVPGRHHLFVSRYDVGLIERAVRELCAAASAPDWESVAAYLGRYGKWEFEDYTEAEPRT